MAESKKPQDHKPKAGHVTVQGIKLVIPEERMSDWDVVEGVATVQDETSDQAQKLVASVRVMRRMFGDDFERVKSELRTANGGRLNAEDMSSFLTEVFGQINPN